ncbi:uncharacterized protein LOC143259445 [Megalopta genalis]|uniref:uncharacterized protein LOC143259445 n=1 Tax=Megalopta genalis TaxID=115081 RepID=UPI003FD625A2
MLIIISWRTWLNSTRGCSTTKRPMAWPHERYRELSEAASTPQRNPPGHQDSRLPRANGILGAPHTWSLRRRSYNLDVSVVPEDSVQQPAATRSSSTSTTDDGSHA